MSKLKLKTPNDLAMEIVESGRITCAEALILSDRLSILQWAAKATRSEVLAARDAHVRAWSKAAEKNDAEVEWLMADHDDKPAGRPKRNAENLRPGSKPA